MECDYGCNHPSAESTLESCIVGLDIFISIDSTDDDLLIEILDRLGNDNSLRMQGISDALGNRISHCRFIAESHVANPEIQRSGVRDNLAHNRIGNGISYLRQAILFDKLDK